MGCYTNFTYKYDEDKYTITLMLQKKRNCAEIQYSKYYSALAFSFRPCTKCYRNYIFWMNTISVK